MRALLRLALVLGAVVSLVPSASPAAAGPGAGAYDGTDPVYGRELGFPSHWADAPQASPAAKQAACAAFLGDDPNHPQLGNCVAVGPISEPRAPGGGTWAAYLDALRHDVADVPSWLYKPPTPGAPLGTWHVKAS